MKEIIAITGPSGSGKSTLGELLQERCGVQIPYHCTTRLRRDDDKPGFYKFLTHEEYAERLKNGEFFISSGDGPEVKKEYGNFYGVLKNDCLQTFNKSDRILLFVSYRDIEHISKIKQEEKDLSIQIVNLTFTDLDKNIAERLAKRGTCSTIDTIKRIQNAKELHEKYRKALDRLVDVTIYTDIYDINQMYKEAITKLELCERGDYSEFR